MAIKNIIFDVDGVLVDLDHGLRGYLRTLPEYAEIDYSDFARLFPRAFDRGSFELPDEFKPGWLASPFWNDRPVLPGVPEALAKLRAAGYNLALLSAASGRPEEKREWLRGLFGKYVRDIEISGLGDKVDFIREILARHGWTAEETIMVDDRFPNLRSALNAGIGAVRLLPRLGVKELPLDLAALRTIESLTELTELLENGGL